MLKDNKLLLDQDCPMCRAYGRCFVKLGIVDTETLHPYQQAGGEVVAKVDMERARNEIALHDTVSGRTCYGVDALIAILGDRSRTLGKLLGLPWVKFMLWRMYRFISYNRKVMYPFSSHGSTRPCVPDVNLKYRWTFITVATLLTALVLNVYSQKMLQAVGVVHFPGMEFFICGGQILWQSFLLRNRDLTTRMDYLGNMTTVSLVGAVFLLPMLAITAWVSVAPFLLTGWFMAVVAFMFELHRRRCVILGLPFKVTLSWLIYRVFTLVVLTILIVVL